MNSPSRNARSHDISRTHRLSGESNFAAVYDACVRESAGPLTIYAKPNELSHDRLGLSIRAGAARHDEIGSQAMRESFRLLQHDLPVGYIRSSS